MKSVRIFYTKSGRMKFVSHLDMNRLMIKVIRKSGIPVWYTEGFNRHIYINYAVPLSLGFEGVYEVMDIRITDDGFSFDEILQRLNAAAPEDIEFFRAEEPVLPTVDIAFAEYELTFDPENAQLYDKLKEFLSKESVICSKKDKKGRIKEFDIIPKIKSADFKGDKALLVLSAGNEGNLNPSLVLSAFFEQMNIAPAFCSVKRLMLFDRDLKPFK
ncbi:MAG: TIGR03936 family radical SAM-associated protein [Acutalibacteraceae bacterium]|nr:TIGR03936 family radical SAM-associated protein [Acutalibacteraceae bacterium]